MKNTDDFSSQESHAIALDASDPLLRFRERFFVPAGKIYFDGNSLGLLSKDSQKCVERVIDEWKTDAIDGWMDTEKPWLYFAERFGAEMSELVGARPEEVVATGTTTINLHALVSTFFQPEGRRKKILADELNFPSDIYALQSQIRMRGGDPAEDLVLAPSANGRHLDESEIIDHMTEDIAVAVLPSVLYRSGQLLDIERLTREAHRRGIVIGWDCSHSVGVLPHYLDDWDVDFAFWCSYKYLNGGPGSPAFLFVRDRHFNREPALTGWFGYRKDKQFEMLLDFEPQRSAGGWQISSPGILGAAPIEGSLAIIREAGIAAVREKSLRMTSYLCHLVDNELAGDRYGFTIGSPREAAKRGGHVALEHGSHAAGVFAALKSRGVVGDLRPPNVIRLCPSPLYNTFHEIWLVVRHIKEIIDSEEYE